MGTKGSLMHPNVTKACCWGSKAGSPILSKFSISAGAIECIAYHPKFAAIIIRSGGVSALVGLLNAGTREAFLPTMRSLKQLSGG